MSTPQDVLEALHVDLEGLRDEIAAHVGEPYFDTVAAPQDIGSVCQAAFESSGVADGYDMEAKPSLEVGHDTL